MSIAEEEESKSLDISNTGITGFPALIPFANITILVARNNSIDSVAVLPRECPNLWSLDLEGNQLKHLEGLDGFAALGFLNVANNNLTISSVSILANTRILNLCIGGNSGLSAGYRAEVVSTLPNVWILDDEFINYVERSTTYHCFDGNTRISLRSTVAQVVSPSAAVLLARFPDVAVLSSQLVDHARLEYIGEIFEKEFIAFYSDGQHTVYTETFVEESLFSDWNTHVLPLLPMATRQRCVVMLYGSVIFPRIVSHTIFKKSMWYLLKNVIGTSRLKILHDLPSFGRLALLATSLARCDELGLQDLYWLRSELTPSSGPNGSQKIVRTCVSTILTSKGIPRQSIEVMKGNLATLVGADKAAEWMSNALNAPSQAKPPAVPERRQRSERKRLDKRTSGERYARRMEEMKKHVRDLNRTRYKYEGSELESAQPFAPGARFPRIGEFVVIHRRIRCFVQSVPTTKYVLLSIRYSEQRLQRFHEGIQIANSAESDIPRSSFVVANVQEMYWQPRGYWVWNPVFPEIHGHDAPEHTMDQNRVESVEISSRKAEAFFQTEVEQSSERMDTPAVVSDSDQEEDRIVSSQSSIRDITERLSRLQSSPDGEDAYQREGTRRPRRQDSSIGNNIGALYVPPRPGSKNVWYYVAPGNHFRVAEQFVVPTIRPDRPRTVASTSTVYKVMRPTSQMRESRPLTANSFRTINDRGRPPVMRPRSTQPTLGRWH